MSLLFLVYLYILFLFQFCQSVLIILLFSTIKLRTGCPGTKYKSSPITTAYSNSSIFSTTINMFIRLYKFRKTVYRVCPESNMSFKKKIYWSDRFYNLKFFKVWPFYINTFLPARFPCVISFQELLNRDAVQRSRRSSLHVFQWLEMLSFEVPFQSQIGTVGRLRQRCHTDPGQVGHDSKRGVSRRVIVVEFPRSVDLLSDAGDPVIQSLESILLPCKIERWRSGHWVRTHGALFPLHKKKQWACTSPGPPPFSLAHARLLLARRRRRVPFRTLPLWLRIVLKDPWLIPSDNVV